MAETGYNAEGAGLHPIIASLWEFAAGMKTQDVLEEDHNLSKII